MCSLPHDVGSLMSYSKLELLLHQGDLVTQWLNEAGTADQKWSRLRQFEPSSMRWSVLLSLDPYLLPTQQFESRQYWEHINGCHFSGKNLATIMCAKRKSQCWTRLDLKHHNMRQDKTSGGSPEKPAT